MKRTKYLALISVVVCLVILSGLATASVFATPAAWNDANFKLVWERTDKPVQDGATLRSWMWGPETVPGSPGTEPYAEAPGGNRMVQYFDKSRMEVNNPSGDRSQLWFVTNGLLVKELVSGNVQVGNAAFTAKGSSTEAVAGDPASVNPNCPTYASFTNVASLNGDHPASSKSGVVGEFIDKAGNVTTGASPDPGVAYAYFDSTLKHNIPNVFWTFMNQSGPVYWNGSMQTDVVVSWLFAMGLPITEPYWTKATVGGVEKDILVQLFERRVLTYTPTNSAGFQVEMGNVGQHYYRWRYSSSSPTPSPTPTTPPAEQRIAFTSDRASGNFDIWTMKTTGGDLKRLTTDAALDVWPSWSPDNSKIVFQSNRDGNWEIYVMNADGTSQTRLTSDPANADICPTWSANGSLISWTKGTQVWVMAATGGSPTQLSAGPANNILAYSSPDGQSIVWASNTTGDYEVWKARVDGVGGFVRLTFDAGSNDYPTDWHGNKMLYNRIAGGVSTVWSMDADGGSKVMVVDGGSRATYSPDGTKIVAQKDDQIYIVNADGSSSQNTTNTSGHERNPDWSN